MKALMLVPMIAGNRVKVIFLLMYLIFILVVNNEWCFFTFFLAAHFLQKFTCVLHCVLFRFQRRAAILTSVTPGAGSTLRN